MAAYTGAVENHRIMTPLSLLMQSTVPVRPVGASLLAKNLRAAPGIWFYALSFTTIASKLAPTELVGITKIRNHVQGHTKSPRHRSGLPVRTRLKKAQRGHRERSRLPLRIDCRHQSHAAPPQHPVYRRPGGHDRNPGVFFGRDTGFGRCDGPSINGSSGGCIN